MSWLLLLLGPLNTARGQKRLGNYGKVLFVVLATALITFVAWQLDLPVWKLCYVAAVTIGGLILWRQPAMDFAAVTGWEPVRGKSKICDWFADLFEPFPETPAENRRWGTFWMTARGLYAWPMFAALFWINPWAPLIGLGMAGQGLIYAAARYHKTQPVWLAEGITGGLLMGLLLMKVLA